MRTFIRTLYNILIPFAVALLLFTLVNFNITGSYSTAIMQTDGSRVESRLVIEWISPLLNGTKMTISQYFVPGGVGENGEILYNPTSAVIYWPTIYLELFVLVGVILLLVGVWLISVGYAHKATVIIGLFLLVIGSSFLLGQGAVTWKGFHFNLIGKSTTGNYTFMEMPLPWLSTGLAMVIVDALAILNGIFILSKTKKVTRAESFLEKNAI